jgi:hypothetical protein
MVTTIKTSVCLLLILGVVPLCMGQRKNKRIDNPRKSARLVQSKPIIYLEFAKVGVCNRADSLTVLSSSPCESTRDDIQVQKFEAVWLRLRNNSRWAIEIDAGNLYVSPIADGFRLQDGRVETAAGDGVEIDALYDVEAERGYERIETPNGTEYRFIDVKAPYIERRGMFAPIWVPAGRSIIFAVNREHLAKHLRVYLPYRYEWETGERISRIDEPEHRPYFSWYKLRKAVSQ